MSNVVEFVYITLKPDVKPEDPSNDDGRVFNELYYAVTQQSGYKLSNWGRSFENENDIVWVIEWRDNSGAVPISLLDAIIEPDSTPISFHVTMMPPIDKVISDPAKSTEKPPGAVEIAVLAFPDNLEPSDKSSLDTSLIDFRSALLELKETKPPSSLSMGWVERPSTVKHPDSESGQASLVVIVIGWDSTEDHEAARKTDAFNDSISPVREKMLPAMKVLQMRHVRFQLNDNSKNDGV